ncbi:MAG: WbqC family protein, partial [Cyclobacteriaceae bacterium]
MSTLIELHYLPSLEYFSALLQSTGIILEKHEQYIKQSYRNRCYINTANGILKLVIPVTSKHGKALIKDVRIDHRGKWQNLHWRAIKSAYGKAPFYDHYEGTLNKILFSQSEFLYDLNLQLLSFCLQSLKVSVPLTESTSYEKSTSGGVTDLRSVISAKIHFSERDFYNPTPYTQVFGNKFVNNLSLIDLLFCEGPNAIQI